MQEVLNTAGVRHACQYTLYGYWDGLIRVWMTDSLKRRFLRTIKSKTNELGVEDVRYFEVSSLYYMWHKPESDLLEEGPSIGQFNAFEDTIRAASGDSDLLRDPAKLLEKDLLLDRPPWPDGGVKLYITLEYTAPSSAAEDHEVAQLRRAVENAGLDKRCSLYVGHGFARYLLRCVVDDFDSVLGLTEEFYLQLRDLYRSGLALRPATFVIMQASVESDNLNYFGSLSGQDEITAERLELSSRGRDLFAEMSQDERWHVHELVVRSDSLAEEDERLNSRLIALIKACVEADVDEVVDLLTFVVDLEWLFRSYVLPVWGAHYGDEWRKTLVERAKLTEPGEDWTEATKRGPSEWSFGTLHRLADVSGRDNAAVQATLTRDIGDGWHGQIQALVDLRNYAAHSKARSVDRIDDLSGRWGQLVEETINSVEIYSLLTRLTKERSASGDPT